MQSEKQKWISLIGTLLISVGLGCKASVGPLFIYILSYYRTLSPAISHQNCQWTLAVYSIPASILALFSLRLSNLTSTKWYFRSLCIIDSLSYSLSYCQSNFYLFMLFYCWIPNLIAYGLLMVPLLDNIWSNFQTNKGLATGLLLSSSTISQLIFLLLNQKIINPHNYKANIIIKEGQNMISYFGKDVVDHFDKMVGFQCLLFAIFTIIGSMLISENPQNVQRQKQKQQRQQQQQIFQDSRDQLQSTDINSEVFLANQSIDNANQPIDTLIIDKSSKYDQDNIDHNNINDTNTSHNKQSQQYDSVHQALCSSNFKKMFLITFLIYSFDQYLSFQIKEILLIKLDNDAQISIIITAFGICGTIGKLVFGLIYDYIKFNALFPTLLFLNMIFTLSITMLLTSNKQMFIVVYLLQGICQGGLSSIEAIGLTDLFGDMGLQLYPYKGFSFHLAGFYTAVSSQIYLISFSYQTIFVIYSVQNAVSFLAGFFINYNNHDDHKNINRNRNIDEKQQEIKKEIENQKEKKQT